MYRYTRAKVEELLSNYYDLGETYKTGLGPVTGYRTQGGAGATATKMPVRQVSCPFASGIEHKADIDRAIAALGNPAWLRVSSCSNPDTFRAWLPKLSYEQCAVVRYWLLGDYVMGDDAIRMVGIMVKYLNTGRLDKYGMIRVERHTARKSLVPVS